MPDPNIYPTEGVAPRTYALDTRILRENVRDLVERGLAFIRALEMQQPWPQDVTLYGAQELRLGPFAVDLRRAPRMNPDYWAMNNPGAPPYDYNRLQEMWNGAGAANGPALRPNAQGGPPMPWDVPGPAGNGFHYEYTTTGIRVVRDEPTIAQLAQQIAQAPQAFTPIPYDRAEVGTDQVMVATPTPEQMREFERQIGLRAPTPADRPPVRRDPPPVESDELAQPTHVSL